MVLTVLIWHTLCSLQIVWDQWETKTPSHELDARGFPDTCGKNALLQLLDGECLTNRFHVAVRLFSNRSQMTSKCGKNKIMAHEAQLSVSLMFLHILTSSVIYYWTDTRQHGIYLLNWHAEPSTDELGESKQLLFQLVNGLTSDSGRQKWNFTVMTTCQVVPQ